MSAIPRDSHEATDTTTTAASVAPTQPRPLSQDPAMQPTAYAREVLEELAAGHAITIEAAMAGELFTYLQSRLMKRLATFDVGGELTSPQLQSGLLWLTITLGKLARLADAIAASEAGDADREGRYFQPAEPPVDERRSAESPMREAAPEAAGGA